MGKQTQEPVKTKEIQFVIFRLQDAEFGAEISSVLEISRMLEVTRLPEAPGFIEGVVNLRGQVIPVIHLARQFKLSSGPLTSKTARIVVVDVGGETVGLMVDEVPEVLRMPETQMEPPPELTQSGVKQDYIKAVAKLGERLVIILDLSKVLALQEIEALGKIVEKERE